MKRILFTLIIVAILQGTTQAQIVLNPPDAAGTVRDYYKWTGWYNLFGNENCLPDTTTQVFYSTMYARSGFIGVSGISWWSVTMPQTEFRHCTLPLHYSETYSIYACWFGRCIENNSAIVEFDLSGLTGIVTEDNFMSASLDDLHVNYTSYGYVGFGLEVMLYDLRDTSEDGQVSEDDYLNFYQPEILTLFEYMPPIGTTYNDLDVTDTVYRDLFGAGSGEDYTGFVLYTPDPDYPSLYSWERYVGFDKDELVLRIIVKQPVPSLSSYGLLVFAIVFSGYAIIKQRMA